jgi:hypothetical protein
MVASALSTIIASIPLFWAKVLILSRFAVVILLTMAIGLAYTIFFLTPVLAMVGPGFKGAANSKTQSLVITDETTMKDILRDTVMRNTTFRFVMVSAISLMMMVCSTDSPLVALNLSLEP